jgi:hypothetical protein
MSGGDMMENITVRVPQNRAAFVRDVLKQLAAEPADFEPVFSVVAITTHGRSGGRRRNLSCVVMDTRGQVHDVADVVDAHGFLSGFVQGTGIVVMREHKWREPELAVGMAKMHGAVMEGSMRAFQASVETEGGANEQKEDGQ